ncbi:MAG: DNA topoisomerase VI subunit B, partial [Candidatus Micrarchaeota archaeon]
MAADAKSKIPVKEEKEKEKETEKELKEAREAKEAKPAAAAKTESKPEERALTASEIEKTFKEYSIAEFFKKNRQMLGYTGKIRSLTTIVHEAVTNGLDACEDARILPEITVEIKKFDNGHFCVVAQDNGTGIPKSKVGQAFGQLLSGTKFSQRMQKRGQQGIGVCMRSDTLVPLADGRVLPIKQIVEENMVGEGVFALDVNRLKITQTKIKACMKLERDSFIEVSTSKGRTIFLTHENPVLTVENGLPAWTAASSLKPGQKIAAPAILQKTADASGSDGRKSVLELLDDHSLQVDEPVLVKQVHALLKQKIGGFNRVARATGISKDVLRNWFSRKMRGGNANPRGRPSIRHLLLLAEYAGLSEKTVLDNVHRVGRRGTFVKIPERITPDLCWLAGIIAGDGHITSEKDDHWGAAITLANQDKQLIDVFCDKMHETFGVNYRVLYNDEKRYYTAVTSSTLAAKVFKLLGVPRGRKFDSFDLPPLLLSLDDQNLSAYLRGLFDAEGSIAKRNRAVTLMIANKNALEKIFYALLRFGIFASTNKAGKHRRIMICGRRNLELFVDAIGFTNAAKNQLIKQIINRITASRAPSKTLELQAQTREIIKNKPEFRSMPNSVKAAVKRGAFTPNTLQKLINSLAARSNRECNARTAESEDGTVMLQKTLSLLTGDVNWLTVTSVREAPNDEEFVYALEVEGFHNFVAGGLIVHNSYAVLFSQITTGKPAHIKTSTGDYKVFEADVSIDVKKNTPLVLNFKEYSGKFQGTRFEAEFAEVDYNKSEYSVAEYLRRTAIANPHAQITFISPENEVTVFPRSSTAIPKKPKPVLPHPLGLTTSDIMDMASVSKARKISSFFTTEFARFSSDKMDEIVKMLPNVDFDRAPKNIQWQEAEAVVKCIAQLKWIAADASVLQPIGETNVAKSLKNLLKPEQLAVIERKPKVFRGGIPFSVEAAIAYGGNSGASGDGKKGEILRFANRAPLLFDSGNCAISEAVKTIDWSRYDLKDWENMPISIFVHFVSVYVPYTGAGKLAVSAEEEIVQEIRFALMDCARQIGIYLHGLAHAEEQ